MSRNALTGLHRDYSMSVRDTRPVFAKSTNNYLPDHLLKHCHPSTNTHVSQRAKHDRPAAHRVSQEHRPLRPDTAHEPLQILRQIFVSVRPSMRTLPVVPGVHSENRPSGVQLFGERLAETPPVGLGAEEAVQHHQGRRVGVGHVVGGARKPDRDWSTGEVAEGRCRW